jgi:hypothetical protein
VLRLLFCSRDKRHMPRMERPHCGHQCDLLSILSEQFQAAPKLRNKVNDLQL